MKLLRPLAAIGAFLSLLIPETAYMAIIQVPTTVYGTDSGSPCILANLFCGRGGASGLAYYMETTLFGGMQILFLALAIAMFAQYGVRLALESSDESTISETKNAYTYAVFGAVIVTIASFIVRAVGQPDAILGVGNNAGVLVNTGAVRAGLGSIELFIRVMVSTAVGAVIAYQGIRLIILQGKDAEVDEQKKHFLHALIGVAIILLANVVVNSFVPGVGGSSELAVQIVGIANFLMVIIGGLAVLSFIVAGILLILSTDEGLKDRAKKIIFTTIITMVIVLCTYTIVNFIIGINPTGFSVFPT